MMSKSSFGSSCWVVLQFLLRHYCLWPNLSKAFCYFWVGPSNAPGRGTAGEILQINTAMKSSFGSWNPSRSHHPSTYNASASQMGGFYPFLSGEFWVTPVCAYSLCVALSLRITPSGVLGNITSWLCASDSSTYWTVSLAWLSNYMEEVQLQVYLNACIRCFQKTDIIYRYLFIVAVGSCIA